MIPSGLFVRFGEVFEGYLPARRLPGDYFELNDARHRAGRPARRRGLPARRPDRACVVEEIRRWEGKVELSPADGRDAEWWQEPCVNRP